MSPLELINLMNHIGFRTRFTTLLYLKKNLGHPHIILVIDEVCGAGVLSFIIYVAQTKVTNLRHL